MPLLEAEGLGLDYPQPGGAVAAVRGVSLAVEASELVVVTGDSGSGKSTLLSLLGTLLVPTAGRLRFRGEALEGAAPGRLAALRRSSFGFVFQDFQLMRHLSALDNVVLAHAVCGRAVRRADAAELLERLGLGRRLGHRPDALSRGEMQRVALARALAGDPAVLFADEPTANLDRANGEAVLDILRGRCREGLAVVLATHRLDGVPGARELRLSFGRPAPPS